jgi:predicted MFS family arabinose efflux permease
LATPLYVLYHVRILGADEGWIGLNGTIAGLSGILGYLVWRWAITRYADLRVRTLTILWSGFYPLLIGLLGSLKIILIATALNWLIVPGFNHSHVNTFLRTIPEDRRPEYYAAFSAAMNLGSFFCLLTGVFLAVQIGFSSLLVVCVVISIIGAFSFYFWPVKL